MLIKLGLDGSDMRSSIITQALTELDRDPSSCGRGRFLHGGDGDVQCAHQAVP